MAHFALASLPCDLRDVCVTFDLWNVVCLRFLHRLNVPVYFQLKFCQFWECFWGLKRSFFSSDKRGRAAVFTLLSVTCTFLCACVCLCGLEVMENTNVKKFCYDVLSLIHSIPLVVSITLYTKVILKRILSKNPDTELWDFYVLRVTIIT